MLMFEDMIVGRIDRYGSKRIEREEVIAFARAYDPQPFHLDDAAAAANPLFGRLCASGWHTAAMVHRMGVDYWADKGRAILGGLGMEDLAFLAPVYPGDVLRCESEILEARTSASRPSVGVVKGRTTAFNQDDVGVLRVVGSFLIRRHEGK